VTNYQQQYGSDDNDNGDDSFPAEYSHSPSPSTWHLTHSNLLETHFVLSSPDVITDVRTATWERGTLKCRTGHWRTTVQMWTA